MNVRVGEKLVFFLSWVILLFSTPLQARLSTLSKNDPFPAFSTHVPNDFLYMYHKSYIKGMEDEDVDRRLGFAVSPFYQRAKIGRNRDRVYANLGDLTGRWNMVGLLYGDIPCNQERGDALTEAFQCAQFCQGMAFCGQEVLPDPSFNSTRWMHDPTLTDTTQRFGFFSVPLKYRKVGVRFEATGLLTHDIGLNMVWGVADITQTTTGMTDLTGSYSTESITGGPDNIFGSSSSQNELHQYITQKMDTIFKEMGLDTCEFHEASLEDLQVSLFWRHAFDVNTTSHKKHNDRYPEFLFIPFLTIDGTLAVGKKQCPTKAFALSFGNNGHNALGFSAGFNLDFFETVEIGISGGGAYFFKREINNMFIPTHERQSGIFPFKTDVCYKPGNNWHFTALVNAYQFIENLTFHLQYIFVSHSQDNICLLRPNNGTHVKVVSCPEASDDVDDVFAQSPCSCTFSSEAVDNVFKPCCLAERTSWSSQMLDFAFNYDISPQASLGFLWQIPLKQRNAYRSNTIMASFEARF